ncbi:NADPH-dependent F420 reductase [Algoriphagus litoralis]|uniref:NADPH-dependent F420 reductase n=1 Tax=Algoriphagus litoralis TaxID=2202829 RepID=UPI000DB9BD86|nr:NAD(P)-binding domain-containing protein [Algoriphagus litoralis]
MKLGILGGTMLSKTLGKKYLEAGLSVVFGVRSDFDTENIEWKTLNRLYNRICPFESAIIQSEILLICCENAYLPEICEALKRVELDGKLIIDCTNANYDKALASNNTQQIVQAAPKASIFKAFNNLGIDYPNSDVLGIIKETYFCSDSEAEKIRIKRLIELIGFRAIDAGKMDNAPLLEAFYHLTKEIGWNKKEHSNYHFKLISA